MSFIFEEFPFPIFCPTPSIQKWFIMGGWVKRRNVFGTKSVSPFGVIHFLEFPIPIFCPYSEYTDMVYNKRLGKKVEYFWSKSSLTPWCHSLSFSYVLLLHHAVKRNGLKWEAFA